MSEHLTAAPAQVLKRLKDDGTFDTLRHKIMAELKQNEELKQYAAALVEKSLSNADLSTMKKRDLFVALRKELEAPVLEKASRAAWDLILSPHGIGSEIKSHVELVQKDLESQMRENPSPEQPITETPSSKHGKGQHNSASTSATASASWQKVTPRETQKALVAPRSLRDIPDIQGSGLGQFPGLRPSPFGALDAFPATSAGDLGQLRSGGSNSIIESDPSRRLGSDGGFAGSYGGREELEESRPWRVSGRESRMSGRMPGMWGNGRSGLGISSDSVSGKRSAEGRDERYNSKKPSLFLPTWTDK